jgi:hypothetical protein
MAPQPLPGRGHQRAVEDVLSTCVRFLTLPLVGEGGKYTVAVLREDLLVIRYICKYGSRDSSHPRLMLMSGTCAICSRVHNHSCSRPVVFIGAVLIVNGGCAFHGSCDCSSRLKSSPGITEILDSAMATIGALLATRTGVTSDETILKVAGGTLMDIAKRKLPLRLPLLPASVAFIVEQLLRSTDDKIRVAALDLVCFVVEQPTREADIDAQVFPLCNCRDGFALRRA